MNLDQFRNVTLARHAYGRGAPLSAPGPLEAFIEVTARCNLRCRMCPLGYDTRYELASDRPALLAPALFERLAPIFPTLVRAYLYGLGEPTLSRHLPDWVARLASSGIDVRFITNATLIDDRRAEAFARAGANTITVSIDGATARTYETIRVGASFNDVVRGVRALVRARRRFGRPQVDMSFVAMASNFDELPRLVELASDLGVNGLHVEPIHLSAEETDLKAYYTREHLGNLEPGTAEAVWRESAELAKRRGLRLRSRFVMDEGSADNAERARGYRHPCACSEPWNSIWVTVAGEVRTCCLNQVSFGDLNRQTIQEIWSGARFAAFRRCHGQGETTPEGCANCLRDGRKRHSPFFAELEPATYHPLFDPDRPTAGSSELGLEAPADGEIVTDPLVVLGRTPSDSATLVIGRDLRMPLRDVGVVDGDRFAAVLNLPFVSEGAHLLRLFDSRGDLLGAPRTIHLWRPETVDQGIRSLAWFGAGLRPPTRDHPRLTIDGHAWPKVEMYWGEDHGMLVSSLADLDPGPHRAEIVCGGELSSYQLERLPSISVL